MRIRSLLRVLAIASVAIVAASACSNQGEGQRCDPNNNSNDCTSPNVCTRSTNSSIEPSGSAICCPPKGQPITSEACQGIVSTQFQSDAGLFDSGADAAAGARDK